MFIAYSREVKTNHYAVTSKNDACKKCGNYENMILQQEIATWKLFWLIPIFRWTSYTLHCPTCGRYRGLSTTEGKVLIELSQYQQLHGKPQSENTPEIFNEFSNEPDPAPIASQENIPVAEGGKEDDLIETSTENLGEKIYQLRRSLYMSQEQFGEKIGVSRQTICKWELDKAQPDQRNITNMLEQLNLPLDYFDNPKKSTPQSNVFREQPPMENFTVNANSVMIHTKGHKPLSKNSPLLNGLALTFGLALLIFNIVITIIHQAGYIQFPIFWFYIGSFIAANAMLIPVAICSIAKRKLIASLLAFISYILAAIFTIVGAIQTYKKNDDRFVFRNQTIWVPLTVNVYSNTPEIENYWLSGTNTIVLEQSNSHKCKVTLKVLEGQDYCEPKDIYVTLYGVEFDGTLVEMEKGYLLLNNDIAFEFSTNFLDFSTYRLVIENPGEWFADLSWINDSNIGLDSSS